MTHVKVVIIALVSALSAPAILAQGNPRACGRERWLVKVGLDADISRVDTQPTRLTVAQLTGLPRPASPARDRRAAPDEFRTFRTVAVLRRMPHSEDDGDLHIILTDIEDSTRTVIAEVPDSACALGSRYAAAFAAAYRTIQAAPDRAIVIIDGIGFFDFIHGQTGVAPNGFELHPVVAVRVMGQTVVTPPSSALPGRQPLADTARVSDTKVWVNTGSMVYHCPGTRYYGATRRGSYMTERQALAAGARPAYGRRCS